MNKLYKLVKNVIFTVILQHIKPSSVVETNCQMSIT